MRGLIFNIALRFILCLPALAGSAAALDNLSLNDTFSIPRTARISVSSPLDLQKKAPQRKVCVCALDGDVSRASGHALDKRVLKYLREMIRVSRNLRRRDMAWYYEEAWEFSARKIYGALPPRKEDLLGTFYRPANPAVPDSFRPRASQRPMRRIVKLNEHPHGCTTMKWEMLECGHELMCTPGYSVPAKKRRCIYCAFAVAQKRAAKKPPASVQDATHERDEGEVTASVRARSKAVAL